MINIHKKNKFIEDLLDHSYLTTKISIYFATKSADESFDSEEKNWSYTNLNPQTIRGYVREIDPSKLIWKQYGLSEMGAVEVLCSDKYENWFRNCNRIVINEKDYHVFKENVGNRVLITLRPFKLMRIVLKKDE
jgi:hypothetical protein